MLIWKKKIIATCMWYDFYLEKSEKLAKKISKFKTKYWSQWIFLYISSHSVKFSHSVMSDYLRPHGLQHATLPCPSPTPWACSNSCPSSQWCHPAISSSVIPFFSCLQTFPASQSFLMSQFFTSGGQSIGVSASASVLPMNIQDWFPLGWTGWISLQSKRLSSLLQHHSSKGSGTRNTWTRPGHQENKRVVTPPHTRGQSWDTWDAGPRPHLEPPWPGPYTRASMPQPHCLQWRGPIVVTS